MNELTTERTMTTKELAEMLGTDKKVVIENARKYLPQKVFEQGKTTYWTEPEVTILIDGMRSNNSNQYREKGSVTGAVTDVSTRLTPALKLKKAMEMAQEAYEEELERLKAENSMLATENQVMQPKAIAYDEYVDRGKFCNFRDSANYLGVRQTDLMALLNSGYIYKNSMGEYRCYAEYSEYFALRPWTKGEQVRQQLMLTMKGLEYFGKKLGARKDDAVDG